ncbi:MAG: hypothetical protein JRE23_12555 [Deltaproteobacteria bacterium]|nr:hypothetical protein [Deltaproteobacteria bacterium]
MKEFKDVNQRAIEQDCIIQFDACFAKVISLGEQIYLTHWHQDIESAVADNKPTLDFPQSTIDANKIKIVRFKSLRVFDSEGREYKKWDWIENEGVQVRIVGSLIHPTNTQYNYVIILANGHYALWHACNYKILRSETDEPSEKSGQTLESHSAKSQNDNHEAIREEIEQDVILEERRIKKDCEWQSSIKKPEPPKKIEKLKDPNSTINYKDASPGFKNIYEILREHALLHKMFFDKINEIIERVENG